MAVQTQIQTRRGTAATWTSTNPTLAAGEIGFETDTNKFKIGTGSTAWTALAYAANLSPLTTKGDLYTYSTTNDRLAVGNNGETLVADSSTSTGLRYQSAYNGNVVINGGYDIWQRGTTITCSSTAYSADRWNAFRGVAGGTVTRQVTGDTTNLPNIQYCARVSRDSANTSTSVLGVFYSAETSDSIRFVGQTATLSFYARKGANYSEASSQINVEFSQGTGTDQNVIVGGFTSKTNVGASTPTLTTTWQRFTITGTVATTTTQLGLQFYYTPVGTAGAADYFEITGVQVERGSVATTFKRSNGSGGTIQGELAACQRYCFVTPSNMRITGSYFSSTSIYGTLPLPVTMRTAPTLTVGGTTTVYVAGSTLTASSYSLDAATVNSIAFNIATSSATAGQAGYIQLGASNIISAEL